MELRQPLGFEDALRPPIDVRRARITRPVLRPPGRTGDAAAYAQLARITRKAPEVMVKITGRTTDARHLRAHLDYISRNGGLALEGPDGERSLGRSTMRELAETWAAELTMEPRGRKDAPLSRSIVLSMPRGTDAARLYDAARAFAFDVFANRYPYVLALHDEGQQPHVHLTVRALGSDGTRLNPRKADLTVWRQRFAQTLRDRGIEAEASPRRARGVTRKAERTPLRKLRDRFLDGRGPSPCILRAATMEAMRRGALDEAAPWREALVARQRRIRSALALEAIALSRSERTEDRRLGRALADHLRTLPPIQTRDDQLRSIGDTARHSDRDRSRRR